jgi:hypothetical protein
MDTRQKDEATPEKKTGNPLLVILALCGALYYGGKLSGLFRLDRDAENVLDLILIGGLVLVFVFTQLLRNNYHSSEHATAIPEDSNDEHR